MSFQDPYQTPTSNPQNEEADDADDADVRLWLPQAMMMAEQGKSELSIRLFFKQKGIDEQYLDHAVQQAYQKGLKNHRKGNRPFQVLGCIFILGSISWQIFCGRFMFIMLLPIALGYGLLNGVYLRGK